MFLCDIADFGAKQINVRSYIRYIKGRAIPVKGARRTVMALPDALDDLKTMGAAQGVEGAYLMNPRTGKVGQYVRGSIDNVSAYQPIASRMSNADTLRRHRVKQNQQPRYILHNHTASTSLSTHDLSGTSRSNQVFAINNNGSQFRAYVKNPSFDSDDHFSRSSVFAHRLLKQYPDTPINDILFVATHSTNLRSHLKNDIHYRAKLTPYDNDLIEKYKNDIQNFLKQTKRPTQKQLQKAVQTINMKLAVQQALDFKSLKPNLDSKLRLANRKFIARNLPTSYEPLPPGEMIKIIRNRFDQTKYNNLSDYDKSVFLSEMEKDNEKLKRHVDWLHTLEMLKNKGLIN